MGHRSARAPAGMVHYSPMVWAPRTRRRAPRDPSVGPVVPILQMRTAGRRWAPGHRLERKRLRPLCTSLPLGGLEGWVALCPRPQGGPIKAKLTAGPGRGGGPRERGAAAACPAARPGQRRHQGGPRQGAVWLRAGTALQEALVCLGPWSPPPALSLDKEASVGPHAPQESPAPPKDAPEFSKSPFGNSANRKAQPVPAATWPSTKVPDPSGSPPWLAELQDKPAFNEGKSPSPGKSVAAGKWFSTVLAPPSKETPLGTKTVKVANAAICNLLKSQELNHFYFQT